MMDIKKDAHDTMDLNVNRTNQQKMNNIFSDRPPMRWTTMYTHNLP